MLLNQQDGDKKTSSLSQQGLGWVQVISISVNLALSLHTSFLTTLASACVSVARVQQKQIHIHSCIKRYQVFWFSIWKGHPDIYVLGYGTEVKDPPLGTFTRYIKRPKHKNTRGHLLARALQKYFLSPTALGITVFYWI